MTGAVDSLLFACGKNSLRSPMAAGLARRILGRNVFITSAGLSPSAAMDAFAVEVCREVGANIADHRPRSFDELLDTSFDLIISLTPEAHHRAAALTRTWAAEIEYWPTPDPSVPDADMSREGILDGYRQVRDRLSERIAKRFALTPKAAG